MLKITIREFARNPNKYKNEPFYLAKFDFPFAKVTPVTTEIIEMGTIPTTPKVPVLGSARTLNISGISTGKQFYSSPNSQNNEEPVYDNEY